MHTISVDCPSLTRTAWQVLRDKGATLCRAGAPVEDAAAPGFLDESRDPAPRIAAHDFHPEWLTVPAQLGGDQADLHIMYPGDPAYVQREPPDGAAAADLPDPGTVPSNGADFALGNEAVSLLQTAVGLQADAEPKGMMMPPGAPNPDVDPPALLLTVGHPCLTKDGQEHRPGAQPAVQPAYLRQAFFENERVDLFSWGAVGPADQGLFTIFDPERHVTVARRPPEPTLPHLVEVAVTGAPFRVDGVQVLMHTVPGYPLPQLVLRPTDAPRGFFPVPWDLRAAGTALRTVSHQPGETMESAVRRLAAVVANAEVCRQINAGQMTVLDVTGILHMLDMIPRDLQQIQHFRVEPTVARVGQERLRYVSAGPTWATPASGLTSTTTTSLVPYGPAVECRLVVLLGTCSSSASIAPPCLQIDAIIERLVLEVIAQFGQPVENIHVMLAAGQPPMTHGVQEVLMLVCGPSLDSIPTVVIDERANGHPLGAYSVASCTPVAELVDAAWQARGVRAIVNGAPQHVIPKWATTGDFVQFADSGYNPDFTPTTYVMQLLPILEPYGWPLYIGAHYAGLDRALNPVPIAARARRRSQGVHNPPEATCVVVGAHHGPIIFRLSQPFTPSLEEMHGGLWMLDQCPPRFLEVHGSRVLGAGYAMFVATPTQARFRTVLCPHLPDAEHYIIFNILPEARALGLQFPQGVAYRPPLRDFQRGDLIDVFQVARSAWHLIPQIEGRLPMPTTANVGRDLPAPLRDGTALVQLPDAARKQRLRCQRLRELHPATACPCRHGAFQCPQDAGPVEHDTSKVQVSFPMPYRRGQPTLHTVATPFGRRALTYPASPGAHCLAAGDTHSGCNSLLQGPDVPPSQPSRAAVELCLDAAVPPPDKGIGFGIVPEMLEHLLHGHNLDNLSAELPLLPDLLGAAPSVWGCLPIWDGKQTLHALYIFTDGSFFPNQDLAGWAVVIMGLTVHGAVRIGVAGGTCPGASAYDGELCFGPCKSFCAQVASHPGCHCE